MRTCECVPSGEASFHPCAACTAAGALMHCPATKDGTVPDDEIARCEFCLGTRYCQGVSDEPPSARTSTPDQSVKP